MYHYRRYVNTKPNNAHRAGSEPKRRPSMPGVFSRFRIEALHNRHTIDVPINDNKLVLIGENGIGKSTVVNFIYFFLTNQWHRMLSYEFKSVLAVIDDESIEFTKEDLLRSRVVEQASDKLEKAVGKLKSSFTDQVLYLPAYRRAEQDLAPTRLIELHKKQQAKENK